VVLSENVVRTIVLAPRLVEKSIGPDFRIGSFASFLPLGSHFRSTPD
jgi:hypothetical protein